MSEIGGIGSVRGDAPGDTSTGFADMLGGESRMIRPKRVTFWIGSPLGLALAGCVGMKPVDLGPKTIPAIGDRQISVTSGRPGVDAIIRSETATPNMAAPDARRISGRVIDNRGQPISGANVRLADGALENGQLTDVITDEAGGFTVRGLRASTPYTLIATLDLGGETRVSRARFLSGETQARILLEPDNRALSDDVAADRTPVATRTAPRPESVVAKPPQPPQGRWIFVDDSDQVVANVKTRSDDGVRQVSRQKPELDSEDQAAETERPAKKRPVNADWRSGEKVGSLSVRDSNVRTASYMPQDENPLPPAIERKAFVYEEFDEDDEYPDERVRRRRADVQSDLSPYEPRPLPEDLVPVTEVSPPEPRRRVVDDAEYDDRPVRRSTPDRRYDEEPRASRVYSDAPSAGSMRVEDIEEVNQILRERRARERAIEARDAFRGEAEGRDFESTSQPPRPIRAEAPARTDRTVSRTNRSAENLVMSSDSSNTYRDVRRNRESASAIRGLERPFDQRATIEKSLKGDSGAVSFGSADAGVARSDQERIDRLRAVEAARDSAFNGETPRTSNEWINRMASGLPWMRKSSASGSGQISGAFCDFDSESQQLIDFELSDIKGRPVRFSQMPSDLTLLVFWGTWCKPCHEAMPQLVELQRRLASDNVQILGIAYEEGTPKERQEKVAAAVNRYDINFPLLMGGMSGAEACPVRKALAVRVYPTLVLLDRDGRVLWKDQGVTPATFGRLDRVLAEHLQQMDQRQLAGGSAAMRR
jgi:thiol-disulfide isomerase/thioredoxin